MSYQPVDLNPLQIQQFQTQGFLILEKFLPLEVVEQIDARLDPLFATRFETGVYPDEWHGRPGLNHTNATRQMSGMWRCDRTVASLTLSPFIARLNATLMGWAGGRLANDSCWIKPPDAPEVAFHRNNTLVSCIAPSSVMTCWIAFSETTSTTGTLEIVPGSHQWQCFDQFRFLHAPQDDYRQPLWTAAAEAEFNIPQLFPWKFSGGCVFLHGDLWHGSGRNNTPDQTRRAFAVSTLRADAEFQPLGVGTGYIFSRYRRMGDRQMDESFSRFCGRKQDIDHPLPDAYCEDALVLS